MTPDRLYTPPQAPLSAYEHLLSALGFQRGVVVQPSVYGTDNRATMEAVASAPNRYRAVVVVDSSVTEDEIAKFHKQGARGVRANLLFSGPKALADVRKITDLIAEFGWHLQVLLDVSRFPDIFTFFSSLPVDTVFDHMGHFDVAKGVEEPGFQEMLRLMEEHKGWVKLSGAYRITNEDTAPFSDVNSIAEAILAANSDHVVYGTDWPHPHFPRAMPNDGPLLDQLADWATDPELREKVLVVNPAKIYDF